MPFDTAGVYMITIGFGELACGACCLMLCMNTLIISWWHRDAVSKGSRYESIYRVAGALSGPVAPALGTPAPCGNIMFRSDMACLR